MLVFRRAPGSTLPDFPVDLFALERESGTTADSSGHESAPVHIRVLWPRAIQPMRVAVIVDDNDFDVILRQLQSRRVAYGRQPNDPTNGRSDHPLSRRGLFCQTADRRLFELSASPPAAT
jgi:hypothetical protein